MAKQVILSGSRWRIGTGETVKIIGQPWLMDKENPYITTESQVIEEKRVKDLMCNDRREWEVDMIRDIFNERDQGCILNVQIDDTCEKDTLYWSREVTGNYTVKSAYNMLKEQKGQWRSTQQEDVWVKLWKIKAPPKVLNHLWRALSQCLPTMSQLQQKHVPVSATCPVCSGGEETILHALVNCTVAAQCWSILMPEVRVGESSNFGEWFRQIMVKCSNTRLADVATLSWSVWKSRNEKVWNQKNTNVNRIVAIAKEYLTQWRFAQDRRYSAQFQPMLEGDGACTWVKPQTESVKVTTDAAIFRDRGEYGYAMIARDANGELIEAKTCLHSGQIEPEVAEAMAVKEALSWMKHKKWQQGSIETDCMTVVQGVRSNVQMRSQFGIIVEDCRQQFKHQNKIGLYFIRRSANIVAHSFARAAYKYPDRVFDRRSVPIELRSCIEKDLIG